MSQIKNEFAADEQLNSSVHMSITKLVISDGTITSILKKYDLNNKLNYLTAYEALLLGSVLPDVKSYSALTGWHGIRSNGTFFVNSRIKNQYKKVNNLLKKGRVHEAFIVLGEALHTIQDSTAHFNIKLGMHTKYNDDIAWDYSTESGWIRAESATITGNHRVALAISLSRLYVSRFITNEKFSFPKLSYRYFLEIFKK